MPHALDDPLSDAKWRGIAGRDAISQAEGGTVDVERAARLPGISDVIISEETRLMLEELAELVHVPLQDVLAQAVKDYWGRRIIDASNDAYRGLRADPQAWQELHEERAAWEATLADGLDEI